MSKTLNELIGALGDSKKAAREWGKEARKFAGYKEGTMWISEGDFESGHRDCFEKLAPALKDAIETMHKCGGFAGTKQSLDRIRAILEGGGK